MESIKEIYKIGNGPSSSHTMGPKKAAEMFLEKCPEADLYKVFLYGSLAATGKGHLTDSAILNVLKEKHAEIIWEPDVFLPKHPNALKFEAFDSQNNMIRKWTAYSIGGGAIIDDTDMKEETEKIYPLTTLNTILEWCNERGKNLWEYVAEYESVDIWDYLAEVWKVMKDSINHGLENEGTLPGNLNLPRKAASYFIKSKGYRESLKRRAQLFAYALAVAEENAAGGKIVTAPTCGSCGVVPAVIYYYQTHFDFSKVKIYRALATAGLIGNIVKFNASISGAEVGCQGEIGTACAMASAAGTQLFGGSIYQIEYSAEMGIEHHLGLTCDPVDGLVQIPCIERNAFAAASALNDNSFAMLSDGRHRINFDEVVQAMKQTGHDLPNLYKETSGGGLALCNGNKW